MVSTLIFKFDKALLPYLKEFSKKTQNKNLYWT